MNIAENIEAIRNRIESARARAGRDEEVMLLGATKTRTASEINEALAAGLVDIGENRAQELNEKYGDVKGGRWHFIGRLQTNKVKAVVGKAWLIHSVDSMKLAKEIDKRAQNLGLKQDLLLQINKGEEESKGGFRLSEAAGAAQDVARLENVRARGLMAVVPIESDEKILREHFREVRKTFESIGQEQGEEFEYLSMGMSSDYEIAVEEGSNIVRIGTAIFGERSNYV